MTLWFTLRFSKYMLGLHPRHDSWGLRERERERGEREFTPFQPHRAGAGAARTSPGRSHKRVLVSVPDMISLLF